MSNFASIFVFQTQNRRYKSKFRSKGFTKESHTDSIDLIFDLSGANFLLTSMQKSHDLPITDLKLKISMFSPKI